MLTITLHQVSRAGGTMRGKKITVNSKLSGDAVGSPFLEIQEIQHQLDIVLSNLL